MMGRSLLALWMLSFAVFAFAAPDSPVGVWQTIDDKTGVARSEVRIIESGGVYEGRVEKLLNRRPDDDPDGLCRKCEGDRKDKAIVGMTILWGLRKDGDQWTGGQILDPKNGSVYRCKMKLHDAGARLEVRGFIGVSLIGRSQHWKRLE
ncbi:MAG: DUF2147 domain-containing protein [Betaproteobacteria bacterium]|nr:DUF2147 domain-containing protein [Betaproteobacteria bacterium]